MGIVTVVGSGGSSIPVTVNGTQAFSLATAFKNAISLGGFQSGQVGVAITGSDSTTTPTSPGLLYNELMGTSAGSFTVPSGFNYVTVDTTGLVAVDATGNTGSSLQVLTGAANTIFEGGSANTIFIGGQGNNTVFGGSGTNEIAAGVGNNKVFLGSGTNTVYSEGTDSVTAGSGADTINVTGTSSTIVGSNGTLFLDDVGGKGTSLVGGSGSSSIFGGSNATYNLSGNSTVIGGTADTISASGATTVFGGVNSVLNGGASSTLEFIGAGGSSTVNAGSGASTVFGTSGSNITFTGSGSSVLVASTGNETLNGAGATSGFQGFGSNGTSSIVGGTGADTLVAGSGMQTLTGGSGAGNVFILAANGTNGTAGVTISDFGSASGNLVGLFGYGANEISNALAGQTTSNGSTTIKLADNSTVTFSGVSHLTSSSFFGS